MSRRGNGKGSVFRRSAGWAYSVSLGEQPTRRCEAETCARTIHRAGKNVIVRPLYWNEETACERCGGELRGTRAKRQAWAGGFPTKTTAQDALSTFLGHIKDGGDPFPENITTRDYLERWLNGKRGRLRPRTLVRYGELLRVHVVPKIGSVRLRELKPAHIAQVLAGVEQRGRSPRTTLHVYRVLSTALRSAVKGRLIPWNPASSVEAPRPERPRLEVPTAEQLARLIETARDTTWEVPMLLAATTGARRGEVLAVRWSDVDLDAGRVRIVRSLQRLPKSEEEPVRFLDPKTDRARRTIDLPAFAVERLRGNRKEQAERRLALGPDGWHGLDLVSERGDGYPLHPDSFSEAFKRLAEAAGLGTGMRLHDVRHGVLTALLERGVHPAIASAVAGHASPAFTMSVYQHVLDGMTAQAATALGEALGL